MAQTMDVACSTRGCFAGETLPDFCQKVVECLMDGFRQSNDTTVETIKYRVLSELMKEWKMSFKHIIQLFKTHTPVDEAIRHKLIHALPANEYSESILSQDFVRNEKLLKFLRSLSKKGYATMIYTVLAVDGLRGTKFSQNPNYDMKRYLDNLRINLEGTESMYENEPDESFKQRHVLGVRKVYEILYKMGKIGQLYRMVYTVIRKVLLDIKPDLDLPEDKESELDGEDLNICVQEYRAIVSDDKLQKYMLDVHGINLYPKTESKPEITNESATEESESEDGEDMEEEEPPKKKLKTNRTRDLP